jgi:hypothetical protein
MNLKIKVWLIPLLITLFILFLFEVLATAFFPNASFNEFRPQFNIIIILFFAFKFQTPFLPLLIFVIQYFHSAFSAEGWELGTLVGIMISWIIAFLRDNIQLKSHLATVVLMFIFQISWFCLVQFILYLKLGKLNDLGTNFLYSFIQSLFLSLISPYFFKLMNFIWRTKEGYQSSMEA